MKAPAYSSLHTGSPDLADISRAHLHTHGLVEEAPRRIARERSNVLFRRMDDRSCRSLAAGMVAEMNIRSGMLPTPSSAKCLSSVSEKVALPAQKSALLPWHRYNEPGAVVNLVNDFDFDQYPGATVVLAVHPKTTLTGTPKPSQLTAAQKAGDADG